jgi:hypothetical protein
MDKKSVGCKAHQRIRAQTASSALRDNLNGTVNDFDGSLVVNCIRRA